MKTVHNRMYLVLFQVFLAVMVFFSIFDANGVSLYYEAAAAVVLYALPAVVVALFKHPILKIIGCIVCFSAGYFMLSKQIDLVFHSALPVTLMLLADAVGESGGKSMKAAGRMIIFSGMSTLIVFVYALFTEKTNSRNEAEIKAMLLLGGLALVAILLLVFCRPTDVKSKETILCYNAFFVLLTVDSLIEILLYYKKGMAYNAAYYIIWISVLSFAVFSGLPHLEAFSDQRLARKTDKKTKR